jgi:MFS family permease
MQARAFRRAREPGLIRRGFIASAIPLSLEPSAESASARRRALLNKVLSATVAVQVAVVMSSLTVPVLASPIAAAAGLPAYLVGYYSALIYGFAVVTSFATPRLFHRWGGIRVHQGLLVMTALALLLLLPAGPLGFVASGVVLGLGYGPMNPASTVLLTRYTPANLRSRVFSAKQTAVPAGGALAGLVTPLAAAWLGWRGAVVVLAAVCLALCVLIQRWQAEIDSDAAPAGQAFVPAFWRSFGRLLGDRRWRAVAVASCAFGSVQFSFTAVFPTVLAHVGWSTAAAGRAMSVALVVGVVFRIIWGTAADKIGSRPILCLLGGMMSLAALAAAFVGAGWPVSWVVALAGWFGVSAFCWSGIGIAEAVRQVSPSMVPEASAGVIGVTFFGALAGPTLFSAVTGLTGNAGAAFVALALFSAAGTLLLLRSSRKGGE